MKWWQWVSSLNISVVLNHYVQYYITINKHVSSALLNKIFPSIDQVFVVVGSIELKHCLAVQYQSDAWLI